VEALEFSPDGRLLVTCSYDKTARLWDTRTGMPRGVLQHAAKVNSGNFSPDGTKVVTATSDGIAQVWSTTTGEPLARPLTHARRIWYAEFSPDGENIVTTSSDSTARIWRIHQPPEPVRRLQHGAVVFDAKYAPDGKTFATAAYDGNVRVFAGVTTNFPQPLQHPNEVTDVQFSHDGRWLATLCRDGVRVWDTRDVAERPRRWAAGFAHFDMRASRLLLGADPVVLWDLEADRQIGPAYPCPRPARIGALSPDGKSAAIATTGDEILFFHAQTGQRIGDALSAGHVRQMEFSPDGRYLLATGKNPYARIWNVATRRLHVPPLQQSIEIMEARFDAQGNRVVTASADGTARVWDAHTGQPLTEPLNHRGKITSASFSPDGMHVLTASVDGTARLWDARTGDPITAPLVHQGEVSSARFSPDGERVITASRDGGVRIWSPAFASGNIPRWFPDFAEAMAGKRVSEIRAFEFVPADALETMEEQLKGLPADEPYAAWARRFFAP
jgi:WD40 repeat protein